MAVALLVLMLLAANIVRLGPVIAREIQRAQIEYLSQAGSGTSAEANALQLGHCLQHEMLAMTRAGFVHSDTWAVSARVHAFPRCVHALTNSTNTLAAAQTPAIAALASGSISINDGR